jgi:4-hydroxybenzoate polyprenyltransferase
MAATDAISRVFGIIMVVLYFILGTTFIFYTPENVPDHYAKPFGVLLYVYGVVRAYKYYRKHFA